MDSYLTMGSNALNLELGKKTIIVHKYLDQNSWIMSGLKLTFFLDEGGGENIKISKAHNKKILKIHKNIQSLSTPSYIRVHGRSVIRLPTGSLFLQQ